MKLLRKSNNIVFEQHSLVDEMMVRYCGHQGLKKFIRGKPIRFGHKLWSLCGSSGYCFNFSLYCGKGKEQVQKAVGTRVVNKMLDIIENPSSYQIYFDNIFSNYNLFEAIKEKSCKTTGAMQNK
ncbi:piggyBac transposable element-derived protein 3-like [Hydra vulgaris]|uniref:PiggyBac transposable element-derived protein 3-like n=1 Tax=Hydra vulgaris TaxID=6087 RepID=A0ABM4BPZ2_HYDVU